MQTLKRPESALMRNVLYLNIGKYVAVCGCESCDVHVELLVSTSCMDWAVNRAVNAVLLIDNLFAMK